MKNLPMIEFATSFIEDNGLENCYIIGVQHLLTTTHSMFQALLQKGIKPENISILGKVYSTDPDTYHAMKQAGFDICENSIQFDSHQSFDDQFRAQVRQFLSKRKHRLNSPAYKKIIILDDGGEVLNMIDDFLERYDNVVGMEQTSSGYNRIKNKSLSIPVLNMGRCFAKLDIETPYVIRNSLEKIGAFITASNRPIKTILICGNGAIGAKLYDYLKDQYTVVRYDLDSSRSDLSAAEFEAKLNTFDLIAGCSGNTILTADQYKHLKKGCILVSLSSSDLEFDAVHHRKNAPQSNSTFHHVEHNGITLLNSGFAIPFNGHDVDNPQFFQFVRSIIVSCIAQGIQGKHSKGLVTLDKAIQHQLIARFKEVYQDAEVFSTTPDELLAVKSSFQDISHTLKAKKANLQTANLT